MHGRLKVKTSAQQDAEKKAEREKRILHYNAAMKAIFDKRDLGEKDETLLKMTAGVLVGNPDITTLWNIRKEILLQMLDDKSEDRDSMDKVFSKEVDLTQQCLMSNPKSYGAWHHRCWCLLRMVHPDWQKEVAICNRYLQMDERNFHVWDYRRFVTEVAGIQPAVDLDYTMERINANFSNYSSWHLRSKLLPSVYTSEKGIKITEEKRREEIDLVQNAAFTDPEDSSAWFYHTWLLSRDGGERDFRALCLRFFSKENKLMTVFSRPIKQVDIQLKLNDSGLKHLSWSSPLPNLSDYSEIWVTADVPQFQQGDKVEIALVSSIETLMAQVSDAEMDFQAVAGKEVFGSRKSDDPATQEVLRQDLTNCRELLELEPESKWTRLSMILVMASLDEELHFEEIVNSLQHLQDIDTCRRNYYSDLRSRFLVGRALKTYPVGELKGLSSLGLTVLSNREMFCLVSRLDLSGNRLSSTAFIPYLQSCQILICDDNLIEELIGLDKVDQLREMSLKGNPIASRNNDALVSRFPAIHFNFC